MEIDLSTADPFGLRVGRFYERHPLGRHIAQDPLMGEEPPEPGPAGYQFVSRRAAALRVAQFTHGTHLVGAVPNLRRRGIRAALT
jgi:hypothetical protein